MAETVGQRDNCTETEGEGGRETNKYRRTETKEEHKRKKQKEIRKRKIENRKKQKAGKTLTKEHVH